MQQTKPFDSPYRHIKVDILASNSRLPLDRSKLDDFAEHPAAYRGAFELEGFRRDLFAIDSREIDLAFYRPQVRMGRDMELNGGPARAAAVAAGFLQQRG